MEACSKDCKYQPENTMLAVSMHHCPDCKQMQIAGLKHMCTCPTCYTPLKGITMETEETITISKKEYDRLIKVDKWMDALEGAGVDNWQGIDGAYDILGEMDNED